MTKTSRLALLAILAALALLALPLASAQSGPPPGYTDPLVYAQDYAKSQVDQAAADPAGYAAKKGSAEGVANETEHAAWLACWTAFEAGQGQMALDPVCSQFFVPPGVVDAPAEAEAEITETLNGTDALADEVLDAVGDTLDDPTTAVSQVRRIVAAVEKFLGGIVDAVLAVVDMVLDLVGLGRTASLAGLDALADGLLVLVGLPALGAMAAVDGLAATLGATADGLALAATGFVSAMGAVADGLAAAAVATASAAGSGLDGLAAGIGTAAQAASDAGAATVGAVGDATDAVVETVSDAASAVSDTVSGWFGSDVSSGSSDRGLVDGDGVETGTEADGLVDRILGLL